MTARILVAVAIAWTLTGGLAACGGDMHVAVIARVGDAPITSATLAHWMTVLAPQHLVPDPPRYTACAARHGVLAPQAAEADLIRECAQQYTTLRQQTLGYLISSQWLIGESADEGISVSQQEVDRRLAEKKRSFATGEGEFRESLTAIAQTIPDVELEIRSELASERILRRLTSEEPRITSSEIAGEYRRHIDRYHIPERRYFYIAENFPSDAFARRVMAEVRAGRSLASTSLSESLPRKPFSDYSGEKRTIYEAIFKASPHALTGPIRLNNLYFVIEVTRIAAAHLEPLAQVEGAIDEHLSAERRRQTLAAFIAAWRRKWIARTDCASGYVVQKCRQYNGPKTTEDPLQLK